MAEGGQPSQPKEEKADTFRDDASWEAEEQEIGARIRVLERKKKLAEMERTERQLMEDVANLSIVEPRERDDSRRRSRARSSSRRHSSPRQHRRRRRARRVSSSTSSERSTSKERRLRSKWSLRRHVEDGKDVKKLSPFEVIESTVNWVIATKETDGDNLVRLLKHIGYIACKAKSGTFIEKAHASYDRAVRRLAVDDGFQAFTAGNPDLALKYYSFEYMKKAGGGGVNSGAHGSPGRSKKLYVKEGKKPCFAFNKEEGCARDDRTCNFGHWCSRCGNKSHIRSKCNKD